MAAISSAGASPSVLRVDDVLWFPVAVSEFALWPSERVHKL